MVLPSRRCLRPCKALSSCCFCFSVPFTPFLSRPRRLVREQDVSDSIRPDETTLAHLQNQLPLFPLGDQAKPMLPSPPLAFPLKQNIFLCRSTPSSCRDPRAPSFFAARLSSPPPLLRPPSAKSAQVLPGGLFLGTGASHPPPFRHNPSLRLFSRSSLLLGFLVLSRSFPPPIT